MTRSLEMPEWLYEALAREAQAGGTTPQDWIAARLEATRPQAGGETVAPPATLADRFAGRIGRIHSGGQERLSEDCGAKFGDLLERRQKAERP